MANNSLMFRRVRGLPDFVWRMANVVANEQDLSLRRREHFLVNLGLIESLRPLVDRRTLREQREQLAAVKRGVRAARRKQTVRAVRNSPSSAQSESECCL